MRAAQSRSTRQIPALLPLLLFQRFAFEGILKKVMEAGSAYIWEWDEHRRQISQLSLTLRE